MRGAVLAVLMAAAPAVSARAFDLPPRAGAALARGRPSVEVSADPDGVSGVIAGAIDIAAPPEVVFSVVTDCDLAPKMVDSLKSCRILERDPAGRWDVREDISKMTFLPSVRNVFRSDYDPPRVVRFHRVGGDLKVFEGEWRIEPRAGGVRVFYDSRVGAPFRVPGYLARIALRIEVPMALMALRRESLARVR
jgi:ribosome-associated toxin RatA of RatAB toxin-antitoxin module